MVHVTLQDDLGAKHEWHIALMKDGCPMCGALYIKTPAGVVDVNATVAAMITAITPEIQKAVTAFAAAGADMSAVQKG